MGMVLTSKTNDPCLPTTFVRTATVALSSYMFFLLLRAESLLEKKKHTNNWEAQ